MTPSCSSDFVFTASWIKHLHAYCLRLPACVQESTANGAGSRTGGLLSSFVRNIGVNVMGTQSLSLEDIRPALEGLKSKFIDRNVAEEIASK